MHKKRIKERLQQTGQLSWEEVFLPGRKRPLPFPLKQNNFSRAHPDITLTQRYRTLKNWLGIKTAAAP